MNILSTFDFRQPAPGWRWPRDDAAGIETTRAGCAIDAGDRLVQIDGSGVHTRNGDSIELHFSPAHPGRGQLTLFFVGGFEHAGVRLDFQAKRIEVSTSQWHRPQPVATARLPRLRRGRHVLRVHKSEGAGDLIKLADVEVLLDDKPLVRAADLNVLPEMGVAIDVEGTRLHLHRFVHRGRPSGVPEFFHVAGWQMPNLPSIEANLESIERGIRAAAERGVQLLVTPETSLTGLFPTEPVTRKRQAVAAGEERIRRMLRETRGTPHLVVGLPVWERCGGRAVRYNGVRLYDPDGQVLLDGRKVHSCERDFWHGLRLHEATVEGVPVSLHVCHDGRYPELWTLPVMFGARLVIHPSNGGQVGGTIDAFEAQARQSTSTMHAFYLKVNGGGGSCLVSPHKFDNILAASDECRRDQPAFPLAGAPGECLLASRIRVHDAFGYWPVRSFRVSEDVARAYVDLYRGLGGRG